MWIVDIWPNIYLQGQRTQIDSYQANNFSRLYDFSQKPIILGILQLKLIPIFSRDILLLKKLEIEKTKPAFITLRCQLNE